MDSSPSPQTCLCLMTQKAARSLARRFDEALRPAGVTSGQFSLLMALARSEPAPMGLLAEILGLDRTSLTAQAKPLIREGLTRIEADARDRRRRLLRLTPKGSKRLAAALPLWRRAHLGLEDELARADRADRADADLGAVRAALLSLARPPSAAGAAP
ncbi:MAG: MarR family winged helix-turn-helix transcriptional regulator [Caulobacteraceae bacterium]